MAPSIMELHGDAKPKFTDWRGAKVYVSPISFFDAPSYFAENLCKAIPRKRGHRRLLDVGCGSGIIGIYCLLEDKADFVTFTDVQCHAIAESCANVKRHIERGKLRPEQAAFVEHCPFEKIPPDIAAHHNLIVFNPPQIPERYVDRALVQSTKADASMSYFRLGGRDGLKIVRKFLQWYDGLGPKRPNAIVQLSSFIGRSLIEKTISEQELSCEITLSEPVDLRPMFWKAVEALSDEERVDRALIKKKNGAWMKRLLTLSFQ